MLLNADALAERVSGETGLVFAGTEGRDTDGSRWLDLHPADHPVAATFSIRTVLGWRRLDVHFRPGNFAADLLEAMRSADETGRRAFTAVLEVCQADGAEVILTVNGADRAPGAAETWETPWRSMGLVVRRGMLAIGDGDAAREAQLTELWTSRTTAAVLALLPLEQEDSEVAESDPEVGGLPEGAKTRIEVNRYERDRRNRAAALAIHGYACKACDLQLNELYGPAAAGLIEVHHVTPVSEVGEGYIIDPRLDLVPLCPNCHSVTHRRQPPYSVDELRQMLGG